MIAEGKRGKTSPLFETARVLVRCVCYTAKQELGAKLKRRNVRRGNVTKLSQSGVSVPSSCARFGSAPKGSPSEIRSTPRRYQVQTFEILLS
jgi:hypothetical protein